MSKGPKCHVCKSDDTRPIVFGDQVVIPCGLLKGDEFMNIPLIGCPMTDWQRGYIDGIKEAREWIKPTRNEDGRGKI